MLCKATTNHVEDATSLAFMSKREIYEKLINTSKKEMYEISIFSKDATIKKEKVEQRTKNLVCINERGRHDTKTY